MHLQKNLFISIILFLSVDSFAYVITFTKSGDGDGYIKVNGVDQSLPYTKELGINEMLLVQAMPNSSSCFGWWNDMISSLTSTENPKTFGPLTIKDVSYFVNFDTDCYSIRDAWWESEADNDCDGYPHAAVLCANVWRGMPGISTASISLVMYGGGHKVFTNLKTGVRINGGNTDNLIYFYCYRVESDPPFPHDRFASQVYVIARGSVRASRNQDNDPDLYKHFEDQTEDYNPRARILGMSWSKENDPDNDGYFLSRQLNVSITTIGEFTCPSYGVYFQAFFENWRGDALQVNKEVTIKPATTVNLSVMLGPEEEDCLHCSLLKFGENSLGLGCHLTHQGRILQSEDTWRSSNHPELASLKFENLENNNCPIECTNIKWSSPPNQVDQDGDGYRSRDRLYLSTGSWSDCYYKVHYKSSNQSNYIFYAKTKNHILDPTATISQTFGVPSVELAHGLYDLKVELYNTNTNFLVATYDEKTSPELNDQKFELTSEDGASSSTYSLSITKSGFGSGQIKVNSVLCDLPYSESAAEATAFSLEAIPAPGSLFAGWSGAVTSVNPTINLTLNANATLNAAFELSQPCFNMLINGEFAKGSNAWDFVASWPAVANGLVQNGEFVISYTFEGNNSWDVQLQQTPLLIEKGNTYHVSYDAYASIPKLIFSLVGKNSDPWTVYNDVHGDSITTTIKHYSYFFTMNAPTDQDARLVFDAGLSTASLYLDNVTLIKQTSPTVDVTFTVQVPGSYSTTEQIYLAGNFNSWDPGPGQNGIDGNNHDLLMQKISSDAWQLTLQCDAGAKLEYKYTRGSWSQVETGPSGEQISNRALNVPPCPERQNDIVSSWADLLSVDNEFTASVTVVHLLVNYPNPFNTSTNIIFKLPQQAKVDIKIYDISGQESVTLLQDVQSAGEHSINWDANRFPSGIYFCRLMVTEAGNHSYQMTKKLMLIK